MRCRRTRAGRSAPILQRRSQENLRVVRSTRTPPADTTCRFVSRCWTAADGASDVGQTRVRCGLPGATQEKSIEFEKGYHANTNPAIEEVELRWQGGAVTVGQADAPVEVPPNAVFEVEARWKTCAQDKSCGDGQCVAGENAADCPQDCAPEVGCSGAEAYLWYDPVSRTVQTRRESMRVSWFASSGAFTQDRTGREESDGFVETSNSWTSPPGPEDVLLWIVLRDSRGGVGVTSITLNVRPAG